jgi:hypothetical protein
MGLIDIRIDVSEDEYAFLRWQAVKLNTSVPAYLKRLIGEERKRKAAEQTNVEHI